MKTQKSTLMAAIVCLVLGVSGNAKAEPVLIIEDGSATRILNLPVIDERTNITTYYDVDFLFSDVEGVYGPNLEFDFPGDETIIIAREAIFFALNGDNQSGTIAASVGPQADNQFFIGNTIETGFVIALGGEELAGIWETCQAGCISPLGIGGVAVLELGEIVTYADFTPIGEGGGNLPPTAEAAGPYTGAVGSPVTFDGTGSDDPDGEIVTYSWIFGDGGTDTGQTPSHIYTTAGNYIVILEVTDDLDVTDADFSTVSILDQFQCGDPGYPYPEGDLDFNCSVDLADFLIMAANWLTCTDPGPPCNFVP